jgi:acyl-CoA reductase-like NAD-dependent aldehyde dehydrogenase
MKITSINPATGEAINTYDEATPEKVASTVAQAHEAWQSAPCL